MFYVKTRNVFTSLSLGIFSGRDESLLSAGTLLAEESPRNDDPQIWDDLPIPGLGGKAQRADDCGGCDGGPSRTCGTRRATTRIA